jgi:hypothetical protein
MEKINKYAAAILQLMQGYYHASQGSYFVSDTAQHHYQLVWAGWDSQNRYFYTVRLHIHIREDGKVCVLENNTDYDIDTDFADLNIPKSDILPSFLPPSVRPLAGYAA